MNNVLAERAHKQIYRDGDKVVKVFDANYPKADVLNEALNQARVEETGLPTSWSMSWAACMTWLTEQVWLPYGGVGQDT